MSVVRTSSQEINVIARSQVAVINQSNGFTVTTEYASGEGITVNGDNTIDIGGGDALTGTRTISLGGASDLIIAGVNGLTASFSPGGFTIDINDDLGSYYFEVGNEEGINAVGQPFKSNRFSSTIQTLSIASGLIAWDISNGQRAKITLTQDAVLSNATNAVAFPDLEVTQDGTGGWALTFDTNYVLPADYEAPATDAGSVTLYHFQLRSDGKIAVAYVHYSS